MEKGAIFVFNFYKNIIPQCVCCFNKKDENETKIMKNDVKENLNDLNLIQKDNNLFEKLETKSVLENFKESKEKNIEFSTFLNERLRESIKMSHEIRARIIDCGTFCQFLGDLNLEHIKLEKANFCKNRFCPNCSKRKARQDAVQISILFNYLREKFNYDFIFLTLTAPSVRADQVNDELKDYSQSFKRLFLNKKVKKMSKGYIRKLEMTYNSEENTYHPHYHVIIAVNKSYFTDSTQYISQQEWLKLWQNAKQNPKITNVDIRKFKTIEDEFKSIFEISKYISKNSDYMHSESVFKTFYNSLKGKRMLSFSGAFKEAVRLYKDGLLDKYLGEDPSEQIKYIYRVWYKRDSKENSYKQAKIKELTSDEIEKVNKTREEKQKIKEQKHQEMIESSKKTLYKIKSRSRIRAKIKDFKTGEIEFSKSEKDKIDLKLKQDEFDKKIQEYNKNINKK